MEKVVQKLSEIEAAAAAIIDNANNRKRELSAEMEEKTTAFDKQTDAETDAKIEELNKKLKQEMAEELEQLQVKTKSVLNSLTAEYENNHTALATDILNKMIGA